MRVALAYRESLDGYDLGPGHPFRPERVSLAIELMEAYGLVGAGALEPLPFAAASDKDLLLVHDPGYVASVRACSDGGWDARRGIGPGDTPAFGGMHQTSAEVAGATIAAVAAVVDGRYQRALAPAGGLHHAHRDRAAGFCVYNDVAVAIATALQSQPALRVAYLDIDAHHGDGVEEAFADDPRVLTISIHEDGRYLYPGTGRVVDRGGPAGSGATVNVPLPPYAAEDCYLMVFERVVEPVVRAFVPDLIVSQNGADAHWTDPLTTLGLTLDGFDALYGRLTALAGEVCGGRLVACGGGGYSWATIVPRAWTALAGRVAGIELPDTLPEAWRERVRGYTAEVPECLLEDPGPRYSERQRALTRAATERVLELVLGSLARRPVPTPAA